MVILLSFLVYIHLTTTSAGNSIFEHSIDVMIKQEKYRENSNKYKLLPSVYKMEEYSTCLNRGGLYCKADIVIITGYGKNTLWSLINESLYDKDSYDRNVIHRGVCVPNEYSSSITATKKFVKDHIEKELTGYDLLPNVEDIHCTKNISITLYDVLLAVCLIAYIILIASATLYDRNKKNHSGVIEETREKILLSFSLISNWKKICNTKENHDYRRLKSIQGIRFYNMSSIVAMHCIFSFFLTYISNPEDVGKIFNNALVQFFLVLCVFFVQTFFMISSWILSLQIYNIYMESGEFTAKQALMLFINRVFRLGVCSTIMILVLRSSWYRLLNSPITFDNNDMYQKACTINWWQTFFFVNNYLQLKDICHMPSWYLSVDLHLYTMTIISIYIILKYKMNEWKILTYLLIISLILYGSIIYINDMDIILRLQVKKLRKYTIFLFTSINILYMSTYSSWSTSLVGVGLGVFYAKNKNRKVVHNKVMGVLWMLMFLGLPSAVVMIAEYEFRGITAAVVGPLVKPLFSLGIGIGILGMSHNIGGIVRRICENKYVVFMSNFSFSTYVFQFLIIFSKGIGSYTLLQFGAIELIQYFFIIDLPLCLIMGVIGALVFEQPGNNLQKIFLQVPRYKKKPLGKS